jgi:hypothetical protein
LPEEASPAALPGETGADLIRFHAGEAWFAARTQALWFLGQLRRWGWLNEWTDPGALTTPAYRLDLLVSAGGAERLYPVARRSALEGAAMLPTPENDAFSSVNR